ncbi:hypothetical protein ACIBJE_21250 [Micromonospora sp. NPDC050187]|uniref:hypothetical protein n=1 Tax=Micromonospora sp. NPDC050187 TaxID=3364277 RepID=UPI0037A57A89
MSLPSTITYGTDNNVRTLIYDRLQRLTTDTLRTANGTTTLGSITYGYDPNGNMNSKVTTGFAGASSNTYGYDLADRLTSWTRGSTVTAYAYDGSGNRTQAGAKAFTYDARNRLTAQTGVGSYVYTPRGTLRQTTSGSVIEPSLARFAATHASWRGTTVELEDLLVSLADKIWKAKRVPDLEQLVVDRLAAASGQEPWQTFLNLDDHLDKIAADADHLLAFQNGYPTATA